MNRRDIAMNRETRAYCQLLSPLYRPLDWPTVDLATLDVDRLLKLATVDNALTYLAGRLLEAYKLDPDLETRLGVIDDRGRRKLDQAQATVAAFDAVMPAEHLLYKTYKGKHFPRIGNDIDVLVRPADLPDLHRNMLAAGYRDVVLFPAHERCIMVKKPGQINLHIQSRVHWCGKQFLDEAQIWREPRKVSFADREIPTNNVTADFLIHLAHINFEHPFFKFSELLYLFSLVPQVDFALAFEQARKYRWRRTFVRTVNMLNNIHVVLYGEPATDRVPFQDLRLDNLAFPFVFSRRHMVLAVLERRITYYLLGRVFKIIRVLFTGETCSYTDPPERALYTKDGQPVIKESMTRSLLNTARQRLLRALEKLMGVSA
ncbi:MAG: nucleotidyltransferase family protein [Desulfobacterales bacterium]|nr:nucleotidyltransferase family protein [Desulfobacterales bacterium]